MPGERSSYPVRLSAEQRAWVRAEVARPPDGLTHPFAAWNGGLLSQHLRTNLGIELSARQCRRLLRVFGVAAAPTHRNPPPCAAAEAVRILQSEPFPSAAALVGRASVGPGRKELVLRKIRRLASSGLPLYPFVLTLFDLIAEAIPTGDLSRGILTDPASELSWVFVNLDQARWVPILANLIGDDPTAWPGLRPRNQLDLMRPVLTLEEFTEPNYRRSAIYNEFFHPLKLEQGVLIQLVEHCELVGYYPIYRTAAMKPFHREDLRFLAAAAPHIAHGLRTARLLEAQPGPPDEHRSLVGTPGVVLMDQSGHILGLDEQARSLFFQMGLCDGLHASAFAEPHLHSLLDYVARTLRAIFDSRERSFTEIAPPAARVLSHRAGIQLRLRGHVATGEHGREVFVVLVEQVEPEAFRRQRLMYRYGLAPREAEMLVLLRDGPSVAQIARTLGISTATAKTYVRHLVEKLGVPSLSALRAC